MRLKIRCDGECEKFCKIFWEVNKALMFLFGYQRSTNICVLIVVSTEFLQKGGKIPWVNASVYCHQAIRDREYEIRACVILKFIR